MVEGHVYLIRSIAISLGLLGKMNPETEKATLAERLTYDDGVSLRRAPGLTMVMDTPKGLPKNIPQWLQRFVFV